MAHFPPNLVSKFTRFATVYKTIMPNVNHYFCQFLKSTNSNGILQLVSSWLQYRWPEIRVLFHLYSVDPNVTFYSGNRKPTPTIFRCWINKINPFYPITVSIIGEVKNVLNQLLNFDLNQTLKIIVNDSLILHLNRF